VAVAVVAEAENKRQQAKGRQQHANAGAIAALRFLAAVQLTLDLLALVRVLQCAMKLLAESGVRWY